MESGGLEESHKTAVSSLVVGLVNLFWYEILVP